MLERKQSPDPPQRRPAARQVHPVGGHLREIPQPMLEACRAASRLMGGPTLRLLGVTSALRGEGRSSVAMAMATIQRQDFGRSVALVEMDFENPTLAKTLDMELWPGLAELCQDKATASQVLHPLSNGVLVVTAGVISTHVSRMPVEVAESQALAALASQVDVVIADLPPLLPGGIGFGAARPFEDLVLVVRAGVTPVSAIREATSELHVTPRILLNGTRSSSPSWLLRLIGR